MKWNSWNSWYVLQLDCEKQKDLLNSIKRQSLESYQTRFHQTLLPWVSRVKITGQMQCSGLVATPSEQQFVLHTPKNTKQGLGRAWNCSICVCARLRLAVVSTHSGVNSWASRSPLHVNSPSWHASLFFITFFRSETALLDQRQILFFFSI